MGNPMGKLATGWEENKYKKLVRLKKSANNAAMHVNFVAKEIGRILKAEEHGSDELAQAIGYHVRKGLISEEFAEELLSDKQKANKWMAGGEI